VLLRAGRTADAHRAYAEALAAIERLPAWLRESPDTTRLIVELTRLAPSSS
jgi:hypothetical protein